MEGGEFCRHFPAVNQSMKTLLALMGGFALSVPAAEIDDDLIERGRTTFATFCAPCHGEKGAGLLAPNLTDDEVLHGESLAEIIQIIDRGIPARSMPPWGSVLDAGAIEATAHFVRSIMDDNLPDGMVMHADSSVTPFPFGSVDEPFVLRTFMPTMQIDDEVFSHHGRGEATPAYNPKTGEFDQGKLDHPIDGIPGAIAVNFGEKLSYCFDTTECRLLYTWHGGFMDMTDYWGAGVGGHRQRFGYVPSLMGEVMWRTSGPPEFSGRPQFKGYRKVDGVPEFFYRVGATEVTLRITPTDRPGIAHCFYTVTEPDGSSRSFNLFLHANVQKEIS
jgi:mono/diheme cytochrome c family protein